LQLCAHAGLTLFLDEAAKLLNEVSHQQRLLLGLGAANDQARLSVISEARSGTFAV
jgi:hypothetical protein